MKKDAKTDLVINRMREVAGTDLYRHNAFRITGLPTSASITEIRERRENVVAGASFDISHGGDEWAILPALTREELLDSLDALEDPVRRIVDEVFWFWGDDHTICRCPDGVHAEHDNAVRAHARAIEAELSSSASNGAAIGRWWKSAAALWESVTPHYAFGGHVWLRMRAIDKRGMRKQTAQALKVALPRTLVQPVVSLAVEADEPSRLSALARKWTIGDGVVFDLLNDAVNTELEELDPAFLAADSQCDRGDAGLAANNLTKNVAPDVEWLGQLVPYRLSPRVAHARDRLAASLNNCVAHDSARQTPSLNSDERMGFLETALTFAVDKNLRSAITQNLDRPEPAATRIPAAPPASNQLKFDPHEGKEPRRHSRLAIAGAALGAYGAILGAYGTNPDLWWLWAFFAVLVTGLIYVALKVRYYDP